MSRSVVGVGPYDQQITEVSWVSCEESNCQLWSTVYTTENRQIQGCSLELNAHKTQDGKYAV